MTAAKKKEIQAAVREAAPDNRLSCPDARQIAERFDVPYTVIGGLCDEMEAKVKIKSCALGCF